MSSPPRHVKSAGAFEAGATAWTQTYQYDGFGNLTAKVLNGTSTPIAVNAATNQLTYAYYDGNGNMTSGAGASLTYDVANRLATVNLVSGGLESFQYAPDNKRIVRVLPDGSQELTFYGGRGERLGVFWVEPPDAYNPNYSFTPRGMTLWFGGRIVEDFNNGSAYYENQTAPLVQDRLGTNRTNGARYRPYGEEITSTANDQIKFATYTRDSYSGLDYADQRFYTSTYDRFIAPDPYVAGGGAKGSVSNPRDPGSWNRYAYTRGDPVNRFDPRGTDDCAAIFADASQPYDPYSSCSGAQGNCPNMTAFAGDPDDPTFEAQAAAMGCGNPGASETLTDNVPASVDCDLQLEQSIDSFLTGKNSPLAADAGWFVGVGIMDNIDPRLLVAISGAESGYGTSHVATADNNAFGVLHPVKGPTGTTNYVPVVYSSFGASISAAGNTLESQIYNRNNNTVGKLYSGQKGAYCQDSPGFPCSIGAGNVTSTLVGLGGNPNKLGYPCPPPGGQ